MTERDSVTTGPALRVVLYVASLLASGGAAAAAERVQRGEFHFLHEAPPAWVEEIPIAREWPKDAPGAEGSIWRNWLIDTQVDLRPARPWSHHDHAIEAINSSKVAEAARFGVDFSPEYQTLRIHRVAVRRAGEWQDRYDPQRITLARRESEFEADMATGRVSALIVVDDVRPGDVVRYTYSLEGRNPVLADMAHEEFVLAWIDPILERTVRVELPAGEIATAVLGTAPAPQVERTSHGTRVRHRATRIDGIAAEAEMPAWHRSLPTLQVAPARRWSDVGRWAAALYPDDPALPQDLEQRLAAWSALPTPAERAAAALQAVQDEVRYFSVLLGESTHRPAAPATSWSRRFGDCKDKARLLATLLRRLQIDAVPAMTSVASGRGVFDGLAAATRFDHVIVRAEIDGRTLWLDPTLTHQRGPLRLRQAPDYGAALPVRASGAALEPLGTARLVPHSSRIEERYEPQADGRTIRFSIVSRHSGAAAERHRQRLEALGAERAGREFADYYRRLHGELEVVDALRFADDPVSGELELHESYLLTRPWAVDNPATKALDLYADTLNASIGWSGELARRHPLQRPHPMQLDHLSIVVLPPEWRLQSMPDSVAAQDASFHYRRSVERERDEVRLRHRFESRSDHVAAADMPGHVEQRRVALDALGTRLLLAMPAAAHRSERERRLRGLLRDIMDEKEQANGRR